MKYIYKIENIKNGKIYIGQSSNPYARFERHMGGYTSKELASDIKKYGKHNFLLEILKKCEDNFQEEEQWAILKYQKMGKCLYNQTKGGEEPPTFCGENSPCAKYTDKQRDEVVDYLMYTNLHYSEIAHLTNTSSDFVRRTNVGKRPIEGITYPIRTEAYEDELAREIVHYLINTDLSQYKIAEKLGVARSTVTMINIGKNRRMPNLKYPLR